MLDSQTQTAGTPPPSLRDRLIADFQDRETREGYAEGFLHTWISSQLARIRRRRGLTQKDLAHLLGTRQPGVARMEKEDYGKWNLATLSKVAAILGCRLKVSLETYGSLVEEAAAFTSIEFLDRPAFEQDPIFHPRFQHWPALAESGPIGEMSRSLETWIHQQTPADQLVRWLSGQNLPPVGDDLPPAHWIVQALKSCPEPESRQAARAIRRQLQQITLREPWAQGLLAVVAGWPQPAEFEGPLVDLWQRARSASQHTPGFAAAGFLKVLSANVDRDIVYGILVDRAKANLSSADPLTLDLQRLVEHLGGPRVNALYTIVRQLWPAAKTAPAPLAAALRQVLENWRRRDDSVISRFWLHLTAAEPSGALLEFFFSCVSGAPMPSHSPKADQANFYTLEHAGAYIRETPKNLSRIPYKTFDRRQRVY